MKMVKSHINKKEFLKILKENYKHFPIFALCMTGFLYQSHLLFDEFISGKTVVNINIGREDNETLPAITICLPHFFSIDKISRKFTNLEELYKNYTVQSEQTVLDP